METPVTLSRYARFVVCGALLSICALVIAQDAVDTIVQEGIERNDAARDAQRRVDSIASDTDKVVAEYKRELKVIDGLKVYNALLQKQLDDQQAVIAQLKDSISEVAVIQRQITPLMLKMIDSLEQFVKLDVPFLLEERNERVVTLRQTVERSDVSAAEKFRSVLEAYQIESDYGRTIEAYKDVLEIDGNSREVSFFRMGRIALVYQTEDREYNGVWDQKNRTWVPLDGAEYRNHVTAALRIARKQIPPELIVIPVSAPEGS